MVPPDVLLTLLGLGGEVGRQLLGDDPEVVHDLRAAERPLVLLEALLGGKGQQPVRALEVPQHAHLTTIQLMLTIIAILVLSSSNNNTNHNY